jgi:hypothetical protein
LMVVSDRSAAHVTVNGLTAAGPGGLPVGGGSTPKGGRGIPFAGPVAAIATAIGLEQALSQMHSDSERIAFLEEQGLTKAEAIAVHLDQNGVELNAIPGRLAEGIRAQNITRDQLLAGLNTGMDKLNGVTGGYVASTAHSMMSATDILREQQSTQRTMLAANLSSVRIASRGWGAATNQSQLTRAVIANKLGITSSKLTELKRQSGGDTDRLARKLGISEEQLRAIKNEAQAQVAAAQQTRDAVRNKRLQTTVNVSTHVNVAARAVAQSIERVRVVGGAVAI